MNERKEALKWWNGMNLEGQFYFLIKNNHLIEGDATRHPHTLTGKEIETLWQKKLKKN